MILDRKTYFSLPFYKQFFLYVKKFFYILIRFLGRPNWGRLKAGDKLNLQKQSLVLTVDDEGKLKCTSCDQCVQVCPTNALELSIGKNGPIPCVPSYFHFEPLSCIQCDLCELICPENAIAFFDEGMGAGHFEQNWGYDLHELAFRLELEEGRGLTYGQILNKRAQKI